MYVHNSSIHLFISTKQNFQVIIGLRKLVILMSPNILLSNFCVFILTGDELEVTPYICLWFYLLSDLKLIKQILPCLELKYIWNFEQIHHINILIVY